MVVPEMRKGKGREGGHESGIEAKETEIIKTNGSGLVPSILNKAYLVRGDIETA